MIRVMKIFVAMKRLIPAHHFLSSITMLEIEYFEHKTINSFLIETACFLFVAKLLTP